MGGGVNYVYIHLKTNPSLESKLKKKRKQTDISREQHVNRLILDRTGENVNDWNCVLNPLVLKLQYKATNMVFKLVVHFHKTVKQ